MSGIVIAGKHTVWNRGKLAEIKNIHNISESIEGRQLKASELENAPPGFWHKDSSSGIQFWVFNLPLRLRSSTPVLYEKSSSPPSLPKTVIYGAFEPQSRLFSPSASPSLLYFDDQSFFLQALFPLGFNNERLSHALILWVQIDLLTALRYLQALGYIKPISQNVLPIPEEFFASTANLLVEDNSAIGLHSLLSLSHPSTLSLPIVSDVDDSATAFPGLSQLLCHTPSSSPEPKLLDRRLEDLEARPLIERSKPFREFENQLLSGNLESAEQGFLDYQKLWRYSPRAQFGAGVLFGKQERWQEAARAFHNAQLLEHPNGLKKELETKSRAAKPFRDSHPVTFDQIRRGDRLRALTVLRQAAIKDPLLGNAFLSYCLRGSGESMEGLRAAEASLELDPLQSDVLTNKWSFHLELNQAHECLSTAQKHLREYPAELPANTNYLDSLLLTNDRLRARKFAHRYLICTSNLQTAVKQLFKAYEALENWPSLVSLLDELLPLITGPTAETLSFYGEALLEVERFEQCWAAFERAMIAEPQNAQVVLGYARSFARADEEQQAAALLTTALSDKNRFDKAHDRALLVTLLAEIKRRTGDPAGARALFDEEFEENPVFLSNVVGPMPGLEYCETLFALGETESAEPLLERLSADWPEDPFVAELLEIVREER